MRLSSPGFLASTFCRQELDVYSSNRREKKKKYSYLHMNCRRKGSSWVMEGGGDGPPQPLNPGSPDLSPASYRRAQLSVHGPGQKGSPTEASDRGP